MSAKSNLTIVNVGYRSTNFWVISAGTSRLMVDLGWPGMIRPLLANLKRMDIPIEEVRYGLATHYHIDHAGAAQDLKQLGMKLIMTPEQEAAIPAMKQWIKPVDHYSDITTTDNLVLPTDQSRAFLARMGIPGEIVHTPGHSSDSVSLVLDIGAAFTGDLTPMSRIAMEDRQVVTESWEKLRDMGVQRVYAGHGPIQPLEKFMDASS